MTKNQISLIAEMLTDDPDLFMEDMSGGGMSGGGMSGGGMSSARPADNPTTADPAKPMDPTDLQKQARDIGGNDAASDVVAGQLKQQEDMKKQAQQERQRVLDPQFDRMNDVMGELQQGVLQGQQMTQTGNQQFNDLDDEMTSLNTLLGNIQTQV